MTRLYCIPGGGTPASVFFRWKPVFKGIAEIKTLDYKRDDTQTAEKIADGFFEKIKDELNACDRYMFVSSCTGTLIEYELYRHIREAGLKEPSDIVVFSAFPPDTLFYSEGSYISEANRGYLRDIYLALFSSELFSAPADIADRCADFLIKNNSGGGELVLPDNSVIGTERTYEQEIMLGFANNTIELLRGDWSISEKYSRSAHEKCVINSRLTVAHGSADKLVPKTAAEDWKSFSGGEYTFTEVSGDHNIITNNTAVCTDIISGLLKR